jgi:outer membrane lipoprotein LolB
LRCKPGLLCNLPVSGAGLALLLAAFLAACSTTPHKPSPPPGPVIDRQQYLGGIDAWAFNGRVALSDGKDGGSGSLEWVKDDSLLKLQFRGALGRGAWKLDAKPGRAVLETGKGETFYSSDVTELVSRVVGWQVPMDAFQYWVLGLVAPATESQIFTGTNGLPERLNQLGWEISFDRWETDYEPVMPAKITAVKGEYSFKLIVREWHLPVSF